MSTAFMSTDELVKMTKEMDCFPSLEAARDVEYVRQTGMFNMITEGGAVIQFMYDHKLYAGVAWLTMCRKHMLLPMLMWSRWHDEMEKQYGPLENLLSEEAREARTELILENEISRAQEQLQTLLEIRKTKKNM